MRSALGLVQLKKLDGANEARSKLVNHYYGRLDGVKEIVIPFRHFTRRKPNFHIMPIMLADGIDRIAVI